MQLYTLTKPVLIKLSSAYSEYVIDFQWTPSSEILSIEEYYEEYFKEK